MTTTLDAAQAGWCAAQILAEINEHPAYERLTGSSTRYVDCRATFTGYPVVSRWDLATDVGPLRHAASIAIRRAERDQIADSATVAGR